MWQSAEFHYVTEGGIYTYHTVFFYFQGSSLHFRELNRSFFKVYRKPKDQLLVVSYNAVPCRFVVSC